MGLSLSLPQLGLDTQQNILAQILGGAPFFAPLTNSLTLARGTGSTTLTRATTQTVMGYGPTANEADGQTLLTCAANEAAWKGARRISAGVWSNTFTDGNPIPSATLDGIEIWPAATTLCLQSNAFTTTWAALGTPAATQNVAGPDGATSAWTLTDNDAATFESVYQAITLTAAAYTGSVFVKKTIGAQASYPVILWYATAGNAEMQACTIDTTNGVVTDFTAYTGYTLAAGRSVRISDFNANYWRVELTKTGTAVQHYFQLVPAGTTNATQSTGAVDATAQGSAVFYGAQVELGSFASSYIPTTTAAVTRNATVHSHPTASNVVAAAGTIVLTYTPGHAPSGTVYLWGSYVDASNGTYILHDATNLILRKRIAGVNTDATIANAFVSGTTYKMAATWGAGGQTIALNGTLGTPHANTAAAQIAATMQLGADGNGAGQPGFALEAEYIMQRQLSNSELQAVTL